VSKPLLSIKYFTLKSNKGLGWFSLTKDVGFVGFTNPYRYLESYFRLLGNVLKVFSYFYCWNKCYILSLPETYTNFIERNCGVCLQEGIACVVALQVNSNWCCWR